VRLITEGDALDRPRLVRSGWACRVRFLADGRRQILNYYLPGDVMGLSLDPNPTALAGYASLTRLMTMDIGALRSLVLERPDEYPELTAAFRKIRMHEEFYLLAQITRIGRQKAYERVAHLLLEFHARLRQTGLTDGMTFQLPLTQEALADGLGLSAVHVNRTFKLLKRKNYVRVERTTVTLLEPDALAEMCGFREPDDLIEADTRLHQAAVSF
jgi:CRP-like cAMP-binding protein